VNRSVVCKGLCIPVARLAALGVLLSSTSRCRCPDFKAGAKTLSKFPALLCACLSLKLQRCKIALANKRKGPVEGFLKQSFSVSLCVFADSEKKMENLVGLFTQAITLA